MLDLSSLPWSCHEASRCLSPLPTSVADWDSQDLDSTCFGLDLEVYFAFREKNGWGVIARGAGGEGEAAMNATSLTMRHSHNAVTGPGQQEMVEPYNAVVFGSTGAVGKEVVRVLAESNRCLSVLAIVR